MMNKYYQRIFIIIGLALLSSCTANKFLPEGERYYEGSSVQFKERAKSKRNWKIDEKLSSITTKRSNAKFLGSRPAVWIHEIAGETEKEKGFRYWLKYKVGSKPVYVSEIKEDVIRRQAEGFMVNSGFFNAEVTTQTKFKKHSGHIEYLVSPGKVYTISKIQYPDVDSLYLPLLGAIKNNSLIHVGDPYDLETLQREQKRIETYLIDKGFFYFDNRNLIYEADSALNGHKVSLELKLKSSTPAKAKRIFYFDDVRVYPNYTFSDTDSSSSILVGDSINYSPEKSFYLRPDILNDLILINPGDRFSKQAENYSLEHLINIGVYKFVNIKFDQSDSARLKSHIYLTPYTKKSIRFDLQAVSKSNNFVGPMASVSFLNRNAFHGGELLETSVNAGYEVQVNGQNTPPLSAFELGINSELTIPRLITPFNIDYYNKRFFPDTKIKLGTKIQDRINVFRLTSFESSYGFEWRESLTRRHRLNPVSISYVRLSNESEDFENRLKGDPGLLRSLDDQFILGANYTYTLNTKSGKDSEDRRSNFYFQGQMDIAGNLMSLAQRVSGAEENEDGQFQLLGLNYAQYLKTAFDFRHYFKFNQKHELASRMIIGSAWAYGNADQVPFVKQFSSGGSNSIRAFRSRSLGPGSFTPPDSLNTNNGFLDQTGDIKLETNLEYRFPIYGVVRGGAFLDIGNVWLMRERNERPGGAFEPERFLDELAIGTGVGFRFDFSFFLLRLDLAFPLRDPERQKNDRWIAGDIDPLDSGWRRDNLILNIAIGHAF